MFKELNRETLSSWRFLKLEKINLEWGRVYETAWRVWWKNAVAGLVRNIENQSYILIEQYRYPVKSKVLELVAWVVDKSSSLEQIMKEEVYEETGYKDIKNIQYLADTSASAWALSEKTFLYDIEIWWQKWNQDLWEMEDIDVFEVPYKDFDRFLASKLKQNIIIDPKVCMAIYMTLSKVWNIVYK